VPKKAFICFGSVTSAPPWFNPGFCLSLRVPLSCLLPPSPFFLLFSPLIRCLFFSIRFVPLMITSSPPPACRFSAFLFLMYPQNSPFPLFHRGFYLQQFQHTVPPSCGDPQSCPPRPTYLFRGASCPLFFPPRASDQLWYPQATWFGTFFHRFPPIGHQVESRGCCSKFNLGSYFPSGIQRAFFFSCPRPPFPFFLSPGSYVNCSPLLHFLFRISLFSPTLKTLLFSLFPIQLHFNYPLSSLC